MFKLIKNFHKKYFNLFDIWKSIFIHFSFFLTIFFSNLKNYTIERNQLLKIQYSQKIIKLNKVIFNKKEILDDKINEFLIEKKLQKKISTEEKKNQKKSKEIENLKRQNINETIEDSLINSDKQFEIENEIEKELVIISEKIEQCWQKYSRNLQYNNETILIDVKYDENQIPYEVLPSLENVINDNGIHKKMTEVAIEAVKNCILPNNLKFRKELSELSFEFKIKN